MSRPLLWKGLFIVVVMALFAWSAYPLEEELNLGLDLQGGIHLVLQVQSDDAVQSETSKSMDSLLQELRDEGLTGGAGNRTSNTAFEVSGVPADRDAVVGEIVGDYLPGWNWQRQGELLRFTMQAANVAEIRNLAVKQALETIRNRVDAFGVAEPVIQRQGLEGSDRIVIQLPGVDDPERVKVLIGKTAFLEWRLVDYPPGGGGVSSREQIEAHYGGRLPSDVEIFTGPINDASGAVVGTQYYAVANRPVLTGRDLKTARPGLGQFNQPVVNFFLTHEGGEIFSQVTGENVGKGLAIILDGKVVTAPNIKSQIGDTGLIEGSFTRQEVEDLSTVLRSGALPAGITYLEERTVGPSLGQDSIDRGLRAGLLGLVLVVLTMLVVYKGTGINAVVALGLNMVVIFGALAYFDATLTLPGIAGIALSSSRMRSKMSTLASTAMPMVSTMPAIPGRVRVALK